MLESMHAVSGKLEVQVEAPDISGSQGRHELCQTGTLVVTKMRTMRRRPFIEVWWVLWELT